jgi:radical SAM protein with 4Fe4S-binding SPASM domain
MKATTSPDGADSKYLDPFLQHRREQEAAHRHRTAADTGPMSSLISVEMNITELCNRVCVFCPRVDPKVYPNQNLNMDLKVVEKVADDLAAIGNGCRISFSGFGESLLHRQFPEIIRAVRKRLPDNVIETNTNGDRLEPAKIRELFDAGLTALYVNLYDGPEQREIFTAMFAEAGIDPRFYKLRDHWMGPDASYGLTLNNRSGTINRPDLGIVAPAEPLKSRCYYPFYKMIVDWNGDVLFCSNDWGREIIVGNVLQQHLADIWLSEKMFEVRSRLSRGDRSQNPCSKCSVHGLLHGESSYERLRAHYRAEGRALPETELVGG